MDDKLINQLHEKYPKILRDLGGEPSKTCMSWMHGGIACGDGWYQLLDKLMFIIQANTDKNFYPQLVAEQIKEKFGALRFYFSFEENPGYAEFYEKLINKKYANRPEEYLEGMVHFAETMSTSICEECGQPGSLRKGKWLVTRCDACYK